jgi:hypothetical protein
MLSKTLIVGLLALGFAASAALAGPTGTYKVAGTFKMVRKGKTTSERYTGTFTMSLRNASFNFKTPSGNDPQGSVSFPRAVSGARFSQSLTGQLHSRDVTGTVTVTLTKTPHNHYSIKFTCGANAVSGDQKGAKYTVTGTGSK